MKAAPLYYFILLYRIIRIISRTITYYVLTSRLGFKCIWISYNIYHYGQLAVLFTLIGFLDLLGIIGIVCQKVLRFVYFCYKVCCVLYVMNRQMKISFRTLYGTVYQHRSEIQRAMLYMSREFMNPKKTEASTTLNYQLTDESDYVYHKNTKMEEHLACPICLDSLNITKQFQERYFKKTLCDLDRTNMKENLSKTKTLSDKDSCLTPCGHCFHFGCMRAWYQQKQECAQCRSQVAFVDCKIVCKLNTGNKRKKVYMMTDLKSISS